MFSEINDKIADFSQALWEFFAGEVWELKLVCYMKCRLFCVLETTEVWECEGLLVYLTEIVEQNDF